MKRLHNGTRQTPPYNRVTLFLVISLFFLACNRNENPKAYVIGFSQCVASDVWRKTMLEEMKRELSFHSNVSLLYLEADGNSQKQVEQVRQLLNQDIDLLIISPNEAEPLTPVVEETYRKGIPVIVVDRKVSTTLYTAYVGGDNYGIGKMAGDYAAYLLGKKGKIIEVTGLPRSSPAMERHKGLVDALKTYPAMQIVQQVNGEWLKERAQAKLEMVAAQHPDVNLVFAHNDRMALGTYEVFKKLRLSPMPRIIGVDGLAAKGVGLELVAKRVLNATMLYPTGGQEAIQIALQALNGQPVKKENLLQTTVIDSTNVHIMQLQAAKTASQQGQIVRQQALIAEQARIYNNQRTFLYILISLLVLALLLGGILYYLFKQNRKINQKLQQQNAEISAQKREVEALSAKAQVANEAKVAFFTKMSHEFRTPLTLILAPLEDLISNTKGGSSQNRHLNGIHKNVIRLLRLVNQLMDFRKIEVDKMRLQASENDLIAFASEIMQAYQSIAAKRHIDLRLITNERQLTVWIDVNMIDKVLFNLLSNAFKFTEENGFVHIYINKSEDGKDALLKVEDNGIGMSEEAVRNAFELFYQGEYENHKGSGLGLALSKEFIKLHKGFISVQSERGKGTSFEIRLPLGMAHLKKEDLTPSPATPFDFYEDEKMYTTNLKREPACAVETEEVQKEREHYLLLIEDSKELRTFLKVRLGTHYEIVEAEDGQSALQQAFDTIPDLIISDLIIPGKDGMSLVNIFKTDVRTSHIPIVLLTGKAGIEHQIEGMRNMADAYITKPFNIQFLEQTIKSLLANRSKLKEHFTSELPSSLKSQTPGKIDRKFISEFTALVERNLSNEDFTVEDICKTIGVSRVQLYRKVKALLNISVNDYILTTRLQKAKYLLQHEEKTISEVAYNVGFSSPAYFATVFKSKFGVTPKAFKEK
jgi:signal transduction histidine kinase/AraC-like DNA-binding protein/CheY-like chemotaxis protein